MSMIEFCVALYDYIADAEDHLSLTVGDRIQIYQKEQNGWWSGRLEGSQRVGWFPASYVDSTAPFPASGPSAASAASAGNNLPPNWEEHFTENGEVYYVNSVTGESSWTVPEAISSPGNRNPSTAAAIANDGWNTPSPTMDDSLPDKYQALNVDTTQNGGRSYSPFSFKSPRSSITAPSIRSLGKPPGSPTDLKQQQQQLPQPQPIPSLTFVDPAPQPYPTNGRYGYTDNFWSDKSDKSGFEILVYKHRNGKEVCKDIAAFMTERARIEEAYARAINDLAKCSLGDEESGTAKTAWNQLKFDMLTQAQCRLEFAKKLGKEVQEPVLQFKNEQKKMRKNYEATIAADRKLMAQKYQHAQRMQKVYIQRSKELEIADALVIRGQTPTMTKKDFQKIEENARKEKKKASVAAYDYKMAVEEYEKVRQQWEDDMISASYEFQQAEEERLEFLKKTLQNYLQAQKEINSQCKESSEMVENSIDAVSKEIDIEMFVKEHFTGNFHPLPLKFEPYNFVSPFQ